MQIVRFAGRSTVAFVVFEAVLDLDDGRVERAPRYGPAASGRPVIQVGQRQRQTASTSPDNDEDDDADDEQSGKNKADHEPETEAVTACIH